MPKFRVTVFSAEGCRPCQALKRDLEELKDEMDLGIRIVDVESKLSLEDQNLLTEMKKKYKIKSDDGEMVVVPLTRVESDCGHEDIMGYSNDGRSRLLSVLSEVKCNEVPKLRRTA